MSLNLSDYRLCFIDNNKAYFATKPAEQMWGDDWDDAPYECNAGNPYEPLVYYYIEGARLSQKDWNPDGTPKFSLFYVFFEGQDAGYLKLPCDMTQNSSYTVAAINKGATPWLTARTWDAVNKDYRIVGELFANATYPEFEQFILSKGGTVYIPSTGIKPYPTARPNCPFFDR